MAVASMPRQPFAELDSSRLQSLSSTKNRQNALTEILASGGKDKSSSLNSKIVLASPVKRSYAASSFDDENEDSENIDPGFFSSVKRSKNTEGTPTTTKTQNLFSIDVKATKPVAASSPLSFSPTSPTPQKNTATPFSFPATPASAPVGRLPKPKRVGALQKKRASLSPYKRIDPPSFCAAKHKSAGLPFSLDAAISGTISKPTPSKPKSTEATTLRESMPTGWFFDIHEDTPDEEAAILMEHSTGTLDISSDDEAGPSSKKDDRGKENVPPPDFTPTTSDGTGNSVSTASKPRHSVHVDAMADVGEERSPLGALPAEDFYAQGLDQNSVEVITEGAAEVHDSSSTTSLRTEHTHSSVNDENAEPVTQSTPLAFTAPSGSIDIGKPDFVIAEDFTDDEIAT